MILSTTLRLNVLGINPAPIPCILCMPGFSPERTADESGSTPIISTCGLCCFKPSPTPLNVPPVPTPAINTSTLPSMSSHISCAVVCTCVRGFAGFSNCCSMTAPGVLSRSSLAFSMAPLMPLLPGVRTSWAPNAFSRFWRSILMVSGMVSMVL